MRSFSTLHSPVFAYWYWFPCSLPSFLRVLFIRLSNVTKRLKLLSLRHHRFFSHMLRHPPVSPSQDRPMKQPNMALSEPGPLLRFLPIRLRPGRDFLNLPTVIKRCVARTGSVILSFVTVLLLLQNPGPE